MQHRWRAGSLCSRVLMHHQAPDMSGMHTCCVASCLLSVHSSRDLLIARHLSVQIACFRGIDVCCAGPAASSSRVRAGRGCALSGRVSVRWLTLRMQSLHVALLQRLVLAATQLALYNIVWRLILCHCAFSTFRCPFIVFAIACSTIVCLA